MNRVRWTDLRGAAAPALPFAAGIVMYAAFGYLRAAANINGWEGVDASLLRSPTTPTLAAADLGARIEWGSSWLVFGLAWIVAVAVMLSVIIAAARELGPGGRLVTAIAAFLSLGAPLWDPRGSLTIHGMTGVFESTFQILGMSSRGPLLMHLASALSIQAALLLALGAGLCLTRGNREEDRTVSLTRRWARLRLVLYVGAGILVAGTLENIAMHHLPVALAGEEGAQGMKAVGEAVCGGTGTFWTILLLVIYLPPALLLKSEAMGLATLGSRSGEAADAGKWLEKHGLGDSLPRQARQLLAILGPFLVGVPGSRIIDLLTAGQ